MKKHWAANRPLERCLLSLCSFSLLGFAWLLPGSLESALLTLLALPPLLHLFFTPSASLALPLYIGFISAQTIGFYWLTHTLCYFGGFSATAGTAIFILFLLSQSVHAFFIAFFFRALEKFLFLQKACLALPLAWTAAEFLPIRIFPWELAHTTLALSPLAQVASVGGTPLVTFVLLWASGALWLLARQRNRHWATAIAPTVLALFLLWGWWQTHHWHSAAADKAFRVSVVQGSISVEEKHNRRLVSANVGHYRHLSAKLPPTELLVWPESVITTPLPATLNHLAQHPFLKNFSFNVPFVFGALSFTRLPDGSAQIANSAFAAQADGRVLTPYHKRILMPFGEYTPLGDLFPWLRQIHPIGDFLAGKAARVFELSRTDHKGKIKAAPLICYEDVIPGPARESTVAGAELLINLTNDAWFGNSAAPHQHHLIAAFRAIENRRFLIRSTNSGLTGIINPAGETLSALRPFEEGVLYEEVFPISEKTFFSLGGFRFGLLATMIAFLLSIYGLVREKK